MSFCFVRKCKLQICSQIPTLTSTTKLDLPASSLQPHQAQLLEEVEGAGDEKLAREGPAAPQSVVQTQTIERRRLRWCVSSLELDLHQRRPEPSLSTCNVSYLLCDPCGVAMIFLKLQVDSSLLKQISVVQGTTHGCRRNKEVIQRS